MLYSSQKETQQKILLRSDVLVCHLQLLMYHFVFVFNIYLPSVTYPSASTPPKLGKLKTVNLNRKQGSKAEGSLLRS